MIKYLLIALLFLSSVAAQAEDDLIMPRDVRLSFVHHDFMEDDQAGLQMRVPDAVSGCFELSPIQFETSFIEGNFMDIEVKGYRRIPIKTKNPAFDCNVGMQMVTTMIPISASDLKSRSIRELRLKIGSIEDIYTINISENSLTLTPERTTVFKPLGDQATITHSWGGGAPVALHIPMAEQDDDIAQALQNFAYGKALFPIEGSQIDFNSYRFEDKSGETTSALSGQDYMELGTITVHRPYNGGQGLQRLPVALKVFATTSDQNL